MQLNSLPKLKGKDNKKKRLGRGIGSGKGGHTVGRGMKGQKARKGGGKPHLGFEGGQVPLYKRLPRIKGFTSVLGIKPVVVSLNTFNTFADGEEITPQILTEKKHIKSGAHGFKVLANGKLTKKVILKGFGFSKAAKEAAEKAGAKIVQ